MLYPLDQYGKKVLELVLDGQSLFVTGKAGTGKTNVVKHIFSYCNENGKKTVTVAPTGVAAKNAEGVTIHSFLKLNIDPYFPGMHNQDLYNLDAEDTILVKNLDIILIDEISMVRCDLLDKMDDVLKHYRNNEEPFGGVQIIMFGDLYQLMPVAPKKEWNQLNKYYKSPYFFSSKAIEKLDIPVFELKEIHRQDEREFVDLLNNIRIGRATSSIIKELKKRYIKGFDAGDQEGYIRLTTHNYKSNKYNQERLGQLSGVQKEFKATIGDFYLDKEFFPADYILKLKRGARVMFLKNDNISRQYVNGTLGRVMSLSKNEIIVKPDDSNVLITVQRQKWDFYRYIINKQTKKIERIPCGSFIQFPLRLAWTITIHKSQGLTLDKVIIDAGKAFTYGQVYVALSRCRRFDGMVLTSPITSKIINIDPVVSDYLKTVKKITLSYRPNANTSDNKRNPEKKVASKIASKYIFTRRCRIVLSETGYYLETSDKCHKLADIPSSLDYNIGDIWIPNRHKSKEGFRIIHQFKDITHLVGYIREEGDNIIYTSPKGNIIKF